MSEFAVIGLGRFGRAVVRSLAAAGQAVLAIDRDPLRIEQVADEAESTAQVDTTDERAVAALRLGRMACVVVTIGSRATEASLLTTAILRDSEVPRIVARSFDARHARLLLGIGAHEVINPEDEVGYRLALRLAHPGIVDLLQCAGAVVAQVEAPEAFAGRRLDELDPLRRLGATVLVLTRGERLIPNPPPDQRLESGDRLVVLGSDDAVRELAVRR